MKKKGKGLRAKGTAPKAKAKRRQPKKAAHPRPVMRWNPDSAEVQRSVIKLVLSLVELIRKLMERQAIRRMEDDSITPEETEAVGQALMEIERTIRDIGDTFDLSPEDLNLDLGVMKLL